MRVQTILVAEDNNTTRVLLHDVLQLEAEWNVAAMPNGSALLRTTLSLVPDLVILDIAMPDLDGLETYELLRQREATHDVPVLFVTANPSRLNGASLTGNYDTLTKPFAVDELVARVVMLLGSKRSSLQPNA